MKRLLQIIFMIASCLSVTAQTRISVFVAGDLPNGSKNLVADMLVQAFSESNQYVPINRSAELNDILNKVHAIHEDGHIDAKQVANATKGYGETLVCGVNVYKVGYVSVFRASLVDVETEQIIKTKSVEELSKKFEDEGFVYSSSIKVSKELASKLIEEYNPSTIEAFKENEKRLQTELAEIQKQEAQKIREKERRDRLNRNSIYLGWTISGLYPWNLATGLTFRYGNDIVGIGGYLDLGMDFYTINRYDGPTPFFKTTGGIQFYFYEGLNVDVGYGTLPPTEKYIQSGYDKFVWFPNQGLSFRIGYQQAWGDGDFRAGFGVGIGGAYDFLTDEIFLSVSIKAIMGKIIW